MKIGVYEIGREVGTGAMGSVHLAVDTTNNTPVAVKRIHPKYADQPQALKRFEIEVQSSRRSPARWRLASGWNVREVAKYAFLTSLWVAPGPRCKTW